MKLTVAQALAALAKHRRAFAKPCHEADFTGLFRHGTLEIEIFQPQEVDLQQPHDKDELYFIATGSGFFEHGGERQAVEPGDLLFVAAGERHRFVEFTADFFILQPVDPSRLGGSKHR